MKIENLSFQPKKHETTVFRRAIHAASELERDPNAAAKRFKGELRVTRTEKKTWVVFAATWGMITLDYTILCYKAIGYMGIIFLIFFVNPY